MNNTTIAEKLETLKSITSWFKQESFDLGEAFSKYKEGAELVKQLKVELAEIENSFEEISRELEEK